MCVCSSHKYVWDSGPHDMSEYVRTAVISHGMGHTTCTYYLRSRFPVLIYIMPFFCFSCQMRTAALVHEQSNRKTCARHDESCGLGSRVRPCPRVRRHLPGMYGRTRMNRINTLLGLKGSKRLTRITAITAAAFAAAAICFSALVLIFDVRIFITDVNLAV